MRRFFIVQISDLHIDGSDGEPERLSLLTSAVENHLGQLRMQTSADVYLVITGDLVDDPNPKALAGAKAFVSRLEEGLPLSSPVMLVPGNHDVKLLYGNVWRSTIFAKTFDLSGPVWSRVFDAAGLQVIGVDTNGAAFAKGAVDKDGYDSMATATYEFSKQMREARGTTGAVEHPGNDEFLRVLAVHHHPLPIAAGEGQKELGFIPDEGFMYLQSPATFLGSAMSLGCQLILHGHRHVAGLARYSVPRADRFISEASSDEEAWSTIYVLSCPSSTGKNCDAGFNIIEFQELPVFSSYRPTLDIHRFSRPRNTGAFVRLDTLHNGGSIRLQFGQALHRDIAVQVLYNFRLLGANASRNDILETIAPLFRRRAFARRSEEDWREAFYVFILTSLAWREMTANLTASRDVIHASTIFQQLMELEDCCKHALKLDGSEFDRLRLLAFDRAAFMKEAPHVGSLSAEEDRQLLDRKAAALRAIGAALSGLGQKAFMPDINDANNLPS